MNTKIINGQTYYESEDVEGEYILLQEKKELLHSNMKKDHFIMITIRKINNMTKKDILKITKISSDYCCRYVKADYFAKLLCEKYDLDFKILQPIIVDYGIPLEHYSVNGKRSRFMIKRRANSAHKVYPFHWRKTKKTNKENAMTFTEYLLNYLNMLK